MSNFSSLKAAIQQYIKTNGNEEITGAVLQDILLSMVSVLGDTAINDLETALQTETTNRTNADGTLSDRLTTVESAITSINTKLAEGYLYAGIATDATDPGTPTVKVFYIATAGGTYTNFGGLTVVQGITILKYNGSTWLKELIYAIDDTPTAESDNLVKSGGVYDKLAHQKTTKIYEATPLTSWTKLERPIQGMVMVKLYNGNGIRLAGSDISNTNFTIKGGQSLESTVLFLKEPIIYYFNDSQANGFECDIISINNFDLFGAEKDVQYANWQQGYYLNGFHSGSDFVWVYAEISVSAGHYYLIPYYRGAGVQPVVNLDSNGDFISINIPAASGDRNTGYALIQAVSEKIGITYFLNVGTHGSSVLLADLMKLPYMDLSSTRFENPYSRTIKFLEGIRAELPFKNMTSMMYFEMTKITEYYNGYYNAIGVLNDTSYGGWRSANINTIAGQWYLINTDIHSAIRIVDIDSNGNTFVNDSVPVEYYTIDSRDRLSWVLVKAKYSKIGISFVLANGLPSYTQIYRTNNNGIIPLILQAFTVAYKKTLVVRKSGGVDVDYTSLTKAILDNAGRDGVTIRIDDGVYDLIQELTDYYGTSDFRSLTPYGRGIELSHDIKLIGSPNAKIKANYTGSDAGMKTTFSPFNIERSDNSGGASLIGINIEASNVRYCVHDEKYGNTVGTYRNVYDNCVMYLDNSQNDQWQSKQCIGGGLGSSGNIVIRNCVFESVGAGVVVSYHNNEAAGCKSIVSCVNNYLKGNGCFKFGWYGNSQEKSTILASGNNMGAAIMFVAETQSAPYQNMELLEWNNVIR